MKRQLIARIALVVSILTLVIVVFLAQDITHKGYMHTTNQLATRQSQVIATVNASNP